VTARASATTAASHEKTVPAIRPALPASVATDRAAHGKSAAAGATLATDHDHLSGEMSARRTAHVTNEVAVAAIATTESAATLREDPAAAPQLPAASADPTLHRAAPLHLRPATSSRRKKSPMSR
jgi:hypothetical protein